MRAPRVVAKDPAARPPRQSGPEFVINKPNHMTIREGYSHSQPISFAFDISNTVLLKG
jgi:hypothetical protein